MIGQNFGPVYLYSISPGYWVSGITTYNDTLIVTAFDQQSTKMIDMAGQEVWSISKGPDNQQLFQKPYDVMIHKMNGRDIVAVTDLGKQSIILLDAGDGSLLKTVDMTGKKSSRSHGGQIWEHISLL